MSKAGVMCAGRGVTLIRAGVICALLACMSLVHALEEGDILRRVSPVAASQLTVAERDAAIRAAHNMGGDSFVASVEMKENVGFLLTPALLLQEVVSDDVVITYPSE